MADLIAIGYPGEGADGSYHVRTSHHPVGAGATWGMFSGMLFGLLFFIPHGGQAAAQ